MWHPLCPSWKPIMHIIIINVYKETCLPIIFVYMHIHMWYISYMCVCDIYACTYVICAIFVCADFNIYTHRHTLVYWLIDWLPPGVTVEIKWINTCNREGNGNPLQYACLENSVDRGAWWAAVYGVAQSRTRNLAAVANTCKVFLIGPDPW